MGGTAKRILVVDDDPDMAEMVTRTLERAGHEVVAVSSGADALAFLGRGAGRCLVLLDLHMVDMNGWEVLSALRTIERGAYPVIIMSGAAPEQFPRGAPALRKPFSGPQLLEAVAAAVT